ncbi:MAG TPA: flagellar filament capping protein FliD [Acidobacteriota bacterium]|nr:flagellar filament capping protein FliD [Acidobacteriota bacterium]
MGSFSIPGLGGGLDVQGIVSQIMFVEREPVRNIERKIDSTQQKINAYNDLNSKLSSLLSKLEALNGPDQFSARKASSSMTELLTASASSTASPGNYQLQVARLALFDNFASQSSFASSDQTIGTGSFELTVGSETVTITIDSSNNTLSGLRDEIRKAGIPVNPSIIYDGSGYRLTLTSKESGAENAISISNNNLTLADGSTPFSLARTHQIGDISELDASFTVNGLQVTSSSNQVKDVIEGVALNLHGTSESTITLSVTNDVETTKTAIGDFVTAYNEVYSFINSQFQVVEATERAGTLAGDYLLRNIQSELAAIVSGSVGSGPVSTLAAAGIELQNDGTLKINEDVLSDVLETQFDELKNLFLAVGEASHSRATYLGSSSKTQAGTYEINITQVAENAEVVGPNVISGTLGTDEVLTFTLGSKTSVVSLTSGLTLNEIISRINAQFQEDGLALMASNDGADRLRIQSERAGSEVSFSVTSDTDSGGTGIGITGLSDTGQDIEGSYVDVATGTVYSAKGTGEVLVGLEGPVQDLRVSIDADSPGSFGTLHLSTGYAEQLQRLLKSVTDSLEGPISTSVNNLEATIKSLRDDITRLEDRLALREANLIDQFSRANQALQLLQQMQNSLTAQFNQLNF